MNGNVYQDRQRRSRAGVKAFVLPVLMAALFALLPIVLAAQSVTGTIDGFVTDSSGANVPNATVTVTEVATQIVHTTKSNATGAFTVPQLNPGLYDVAVTASGFSKAVRSSIELQVNQVASLTIPLAVGSAADTVQVSGQEPLLDIDNVSLGTVIGADEIADLPLNGRQFIQLLQLVPGVAPTSVSQNGSQIPIGAGAVNPAIGGATNRSNLFFIDGVFATNPTYTIYAVSPPSDVIQEFQEQSHASAAEFGGATGGTVSISTKAGTNQFHGSAYEFIKNDSLDAVSYFQNKYWYGNPDGKAPRYQQNQFGATFGGPIFKDKLFFFGNYEGYRVASQTSPANVGLPTAAQLGGDFSALLGTTTIYDPATYDANSGTIQAFPGNIIPTSRLNTQLINVVKAFLPSQLPTQPYQLATNPLSGEKLGYNYTNRQSATTTQNQYGLRVDYAISPKDLLYGDYFYELGQLSTPGGLPSNPFLNITGGKNTGVNYVHNFSPTLIAQVTGGWLRATSPGYAVQPNAQALFNSGGFGAGFSSHPGDVSMPFVPVIENDVFGINSGEGGDFDTVWQYSGSVQKQLDRHALKFGAAFYKATLNTNYAQDVEYYNQQSTAIPNNTVSPGGDEFAGMFLGLPTGSFAQAGNSGGFLHETVLGFYAQDTWKVNPRFTVSYGLRWDYTAPVTDDGNRLSGFNEYNSEWYIPKGDVDAPKQLPGSVYISGDHIAPNDYKNFSPRLGLGYQLDPKTTLRAGAGIFFDNWAGSIQATQAARGSWPSGAYLNSSNTNINGLSSPAVTAQNPFPGESPIVAASPYLGGPNGNDGGGGTFLDTKWKNAYALSYNLEFEHQLSNSQTFSLIYAGSGTSRSSIQVPFNEPITLGPSASEVFPYPMMYPGGFNEIMSIAHLSYNSFQSKYEKRFSNGLGIHGAFTWSKDIDVGCADFWEGCSIQNPANLKSERGDSAKSEPIVVTSSLVYKLPFGRGRDYLNKGGVVSTLAGGWQVNGIFQHNVSPPYNATLTSDRANSYIGNERYNIVGDTHGSKKRDNYFNANAFVLPAKYTYGTGGRNDLRPPDFTDIDGSIFRTFTLYKEAKFEFRSEFFNLLNHTNFGGAGLSCYVFNPDGTCDLNPNDPNSAPNANFNKIRSAGAARQIQFAGKITF